MEHGLKIKSDIDSESNADLDSTLRRSMLKTKVKVGEDNDTDIRNESLKQVDLTDKEMEENDEQSNDTLNKYESLDSNIERSTVQNPDKQFECQYCGHKTKRKQRLKLHVTLNHEREKAPKHPCELCSYETINKANLKLHMRQHTDLGLKCIWCQKTFKNKLSLDSHYISAHSDQSESFERLLTNKVHQCSECSYVTVHRSNFRKHVLLHEEDRNRLPLECNICGYKCTHETRLRLHTRRKHADQLEKEQKEATNIKNETLDCGLKRPDDESSSENAEKQFSCNKCNYRSKFKQNLNRHIMQVHKKETAPRYACKSCSYETIDKGNVIRHMRIHTGYMLSCTLCQKSFKSMKTLDAHYFSVHSQQMDFQPSAQ